MALKKIDERLLRLQRFVDSWKRNGSVPRIERDVVLEELRNLYNEVMDCPNEVGEVADVEHAKEVEEEPVAEVDTTMANEHSIENVEPEVQPIPEPIPAPEPEPAPVSEITLSVVPTKHEDMGEAFDDALDIDALLGLSGDDSIEEAERAIMESREEAAHIAEEPVAESGAEAIMEPTPDVEVKSVVEEQPSVGKVMAAGGLFDIDDIPVRARRGRKMISLYDAPAKPTAVAPKVEKPVVEPMVEIVEPTPAPAPAPARVVTPAPDVLPVASQPAPQRLGDVIAQGVTTLADKMAEEQPTSTFNRITDIRKAIGLNDKFLMIRDLFGGDANLYEDTINHLNEFDDLDECMIFIVENFRWNPDSEGAKLLVSLIERKLS